MFHSVGCRRVIFERDFLEEDYRLIEEVLCSHTPSVVMQIVDRFDKGGDHREFSYFLPLFKRYAPRHEVVSVELTEEFWKTYDYLAQFVDSDFPIDDLQPISEMTGDETRLTEAIGKSKPNIRYVFKVWCSSWKPAAEPNIPTFELEQHEVKTDAID